MQVLLPARHLLNKLESELNGKSDEQQLSILRRYLDEYVPSGWQGPYKVVRDRITRSIERLETKTAVRAASAHQDAFHVPRQGDGRVALVGVVNAGKSAVTAMLTDAPTEIADYPFTTQAPVPGMLEHEGASVQILDTPAVVPGLSLGEGAGRKLLHLIGTSDAVAVVVDLAANPTEQTHLIFEEFSATRLRPLANAVSTVFRPKGKGGIKFTGREISKEDRATANEILTDADVANAEVFVRDRFVADGLAGQVRGETLLPCVFVAHKNDLPQAGENLSLLRDAFPAYPVVETNFLAEEGLERLKVALLDALGLIRVRLLERADPESDARVLYVSKASSVEEVAEKANWSVREGTVSAQVWGRSVRYGGQTVGAQHLVEGDDALFIRSS